MGVESQSRMCTNWLQVRGVEALVLTTRLTQAIRLRNDRKPPRPMRLLFGWERRQWNDVLEAWHRQLVYIGAMLKTRGVIAR